MNSVVFYITSPVGGPAGTGPVGGGAAIDGVQGTNTSGSCIVIILFTTSVTSLTIADLQSVVVQV